MLEALINEYVDKFDENVPVFLLRGMDDEDVGNLIEKALKEDKPIKIDCGDGDY